MHLPVCMSASESMSLVLCLHFVCLSFYSSVSISAPTYLSHNACLYLFACVTQTYDACFCFWAHDMHIKACAYIYMLTPYSIVYALYTCCADDTPLFLNVYY